MALISCPECGNQVSDKAATCPHCGINIQKELKPFSSGDAPRSFALTGDRRCLGCGYEGQMGTWFGGSFVPFLVMLGLFAGVFSSPRMFSPLFVLGMTIFGLWAYSKPLCPKCKSLRSAEIKKEKRGLGDWVVDIIAIGLFLFAMAALFGATM